jgi:hypothetical protein
MASHHSLVSSWLGAALAAIVVMAALEDARAGTAEALLLADATGAPTEATRRDYTGMPACAGACEEKPHRSDDAYIFSATRSLRQAGIHPVIGVVLAPATLAVDAVFFPFAVALECLANSR